MNAPRLLPGLDFYYSAFIDLSTCRGGMGDGPIPWNEAKTYADVHGMSNEEFHRLWNLVKKMDLEYLKFREKQMNKDR